jgi:hypothetical protein
LSLDTERRLHLVMGACLLVLFLTQGIILTGSNAPTYDEGGISRRAIPTSLAEISAWSPRIHP